VAATTDLDPDRPAGWQRFEDSYGFTFDDFQRRACIALEDGSSVLVAAPTGAGKTVVGEFAAWLALNGGGKTFYTTPIKALSNQKFGDFSALHGSSKVGLLTGDNSINGDAPIVVMTTEVLRNMIYEDSSTLMGLRYVVLDEVHYLQDLYRGAVWEEILIHLPVDVHIVSLSATVSNSEEFGEWLQTLRGRTEVIIEETRPVEIRHWYFAGDELIPMFVVHPDETVTPNPRGRELDRRRRGGSARPQRGGRRPPPRPRIPFRSDVVERLGSEGMLPAIYFIFSRKGCDEAVKQCIRDGLRLTTPDEAQRILEYADLRVAEIPPNELDVLGYDGWIEGLRRGIAAHHAGMIPAFKETVEELFARGLVKVVFATETLALGINMPARTVVIESLMKFTGEKHEQMTPGQYTQLSGRAGRRGKDEVGHSVVLMQRFIEFDAITRLASTRTYPLQSSFRPSYNMTVNLVRNYERHEAEHLVNSSFAQFQADREVVRMETEVERNEAYLASYRERMKCHLGDFEDYHELLLRLREVEGTRYRPQRRSGQEVIDAIARLHPGDVFELPRGKRRGRYAVIEVSQKRSERRPRVLALGQDKSLVRFVPADFTEPPVLIGKLRRVGDTRDLKMRRQMSRELAGLQATGRKRERAQDVHGSEDGSEAIQLRAEIDAHPCHSCPELKRHLHYAERASRLKRDISGIERRVSRRTGTLARRFGKVLKVLEDLDYVDNWLLTPKGETLTRVYNESDLLVVEAVEAGLFDELDAPEIAAVLSSLVYETRGPEVPEVTELPTANSSQVHRDLMKLWRTIKRQEESAGLDLTREPDPGFASKAHKWAKGMDLDKVLDEDDAPGDFVRSMKQLIDLLRQIEEIAPNADLATRVRDTIESLQRGVIAYTSLDL
jgi:ATP-dependent RNA helicase HelY